MIAILWFSAAFAARAPGRRATWNHGLEQEFPIDSVEQPAPNW